MFELDKVEIIERGEGELLCWRDPDEARRWVRDEKSRDMVEKVMELKEVVSKFVEPGMYLALGGFGHVRTPMAFLHEIVRQRKRGLILGAKPGVFDSDFLIAAGCVEKLEISYFVGLELRGLAPATRRAVESGRVKVVAEWSNAAYQWRLKAAAMGLPFMPVRVLAGSDTFRKSAAIKIRDPFTGKPIVLVPACYPDLAVIHVHRADVYGNAQIDDSPVMDVELARAARRLVVIAEEIVPSERIRQEPWRTTIPFFLVDAVVEQRWGTHPTNMPRLYYSDEEHIAEYMDLTKSEEGTREYFKKYVLGVSNFWEYLELVGGVKKLKYLEDVEKLRASPTYPWVKL